MAESSIWERVRDELASPWDWVAASGGAACGLIASALSGGLDGGTSAGAGALAAVSFRKAIANRRNTRAAAARYRKLEAAIHSEVNKLTVDANQEDRWYHRERLERFEALLDQIQRDLQLYETGLLSDAQVERLLAHRLDEYAFLFSDNKR